MIFDYLSVDVDPLPGLAGSELAWEPAMQAIVGGHLEARIVPGIIDTGSALTILPDVLMERLGVVVLGRIRIYAGGMRISIPLARVNLGIRSPRPKHVWSGLVGFSPVHPRALYGQVGFLQDFKATFDTRNRRHSPRTNAIFPDPIDFRGGEDESGPAGVR